MTLITAPYKYSYLLSGSVAGEYSAARAIEFYSMALSAASFGVPRIVFMNAPNNLIFFA